MNIFDLAVVALLAASIYFGYKTGIITSFFYVLSGFIGMWAAQEFVNEPKLNYYLVFLASAGVVILVGFFISHLIKKLPFSWIDHLFGVFLGIILGFVIIGTVIFPVSYHLPQKTRNAVATSFTAEKLIPRFQKMFPKVKQFNLNDIKDKISLPEFPKSLSFKLPAALKKISFFNKINNKLTS
ncbi:MAG: CvpA family protein [Elusimicrobia bacterium]|nr:CvpA family protein [Candidatus Liberimonas magnetica]